MWLEAWSWTGPRRAGCVAHFAPNRDADFGCALWLAAWSWVGTARATGARNASHMPRRTVTQVSGAPCGWRQGRGSGPRRPPAGRGNCVNFRRRVCVKLCFAVVWQLDSAPDGLAGCIKASQGSPCCGHVPEKLGFSFGATRPNRLRGAGTSANDAPNSHRRAQQRAPMNAFVRRSAVRGPRQRKG